MSLLSAYNTDNLITQSGKTQRITTEPSANPSVTYIGTKDGEYRVETTLWYKCTCVCSARFQYVGMDYTTAKSCADAMRQKFTRQKKIWEYKPVTLEQGKAYKFEWHEKGNGTVLEAEIDLAPSGGHMYNVTVNASTTDEFYTETPTSVTFSYPSCFNDVM